MSRTDRIFSIAKWVWEASPDVKGVDSGEPSYGEVEVQVEESKQIRKSNHWLIMEKKIIATEEAPKAIGPYSQGVVASGRLIFTAGQIAIDPKVGEVVKGDIQVQTRQVIENLRSVLKVAGADFGNVVKTTVFLADMNDFAAMNEVYAEYFAAEYPARSAVEVSRLPKDVKIEIECIAVID